MMVSGRELTAQTQARRTGFKVRPCHFNAVALSRPFSLGVQSASTQRTLDLMATPEAWRSALLTAHTCTPQFRDESQLGLLWPPEFF